MGESDSTGAASPRPVWDRRVRELLGRMTLEEKVGQISTAPLPPAGADAWAPDLAVRPPGIVLVPAVASPETAARVADFQHTLGRTRLAVPALPLAIGGHLRSTLPGPMGAAATWDMGAVERLAAEEAAGLRAAGVLATLGSLGSGPTWAADPVLASSIAIARVRGAQGRDAGRTGLVGPRHVALVIRLGSVRDGSWHERTMRSSLLAAAEAAVRAGAAIVVPSPASNAGVPAHSDSWLLKQVLRHDWGFSGIVISDAGAIQGLVSTYGVAAGIDQAIASAIEAGVDVINDGPDAVGRVVDLVRTGAVPEWLVDDSAATVLQLKLRLGLLDDPAPPDAEEEPEPVRSPAAVTRAVVGSLVLLSDPTGALPLPDAGTVHVVSADAGPDDGRWSTEPEGHELVQALKALLPRVDVRTGIPGPPDDAAASGPATVLVLTGDPDAAAPMVGRVVASGRRCVVLVTSERVDRLDDLATTTASILLCWHPVGRNVDTVAEVLAGRAEPEGRLPMALPVTPSPRSVTYPLGHGSGYTTFEYSRLRIAPSVLLGRESIRVRCLVTNTGNRPGRDVVQVYLGRRTGTVATPSPSLVAFSPVRLGAGQSLSVTLQLPPERLAVWDRSMRHVLQPGTVEVLVGRSAGDIRLTGTLTVNSTGTVDRWS